MQEVYFKIHCQILLIVYLIYGSGLSPQGMQWTGNNYRYLGGDVTVNRNAIFPDDIIDYRVHK